MLYLADRLSGETRLSAAPPRVTRYPPLLSFDKLPFFALKLIKTFSHFHHCCKIALGIGEFELDQANPVYLYHILT